MQYTVDCTTLTGLLIKSPTAKLEVGYAISVSTMPHTQIEMQRFPAE